MPPKKVICDFFKESNNTASDYPREKCIHEVYEAFAEECPEAIALTFNNFSLTYRELNDRANKLAHYLKSLGVVRETIVGLCIDRSVEAIVFILGILKAGGAYLPLDPDYPLDRLKFMLRDTKAPFLLTSNRLANKFSDIKIKKICFESIEKALLEQPNKNLCSGAISENIAYIMYTSGSTGQPKGIEITHRNVLRLVINTNYVNLDKNEILLQYASISFDASTFEIWGALLNGGQLVVCPPGNLLPEELGQIIRNNNVTTVWLTAALFHNIVENSIESLSSVRQLLAGGDVLFPESVKKVLRELKGICLINGYGPTENTTFTCCYPMTDISQVGSSVPIGRPVSNTKVYILDKNLDLVSAGSTGELYTAGDGVARGYHNRPELTEAVFIKNPFSEDPDSRLYKTGDLVKYLPDGNIEFIGRRDNQVKLRGYRIELGEIEQVLLQHDAISQVISIIREDWQHDKRLVAYYIPKKKITDLSKELRDFLSAKLPDYMIPQHFVEMDLFPITQNGKIDRKALPEPSIINDTCEHDFQGPETELEGIITGIWKDVLNLDRVDIRDNFFEIGGHSLSAVNVVSRIAKSLNVNLTVGSFFKAPTIRRLAESLKDHPQLAIGKKNKTFQPEIKPFSRNKNLPLSFTQSRLWFIKQLSPESIEYNLPFAMRFQGVIDIDLLKKCLIRIIDRHESLRTTFQLEKDIPVQIINEISDFDIPLIDFSHFSENLRDKQLKAYMEDQSKQSFNFFESPILRASIIRVSKNDHVLFFLTHHILFDGISYEIFKRELFYLYESCKKGQASLLPEMPVQYADYAVWQQEWLHGKEYQTQSGYWMEQLKGDLPVLEIHADYQRPAVMSFRGAREELIVQDKMVNSLSKTGRFKDATLFMVLFAAFNALLYRYTNQMDICVGVPVAARTSTQIKDLIGFFTNTLVFRTKLKPDFSFLELLEEVKNTTLDALSNQDMPFDRLVEKLNPKRDLSTTPLYQVMFVFLPETDRDLKLQGLSWKPEKVITHTAQTDLSIWIDKLDDGMNIAIEYNTDLFRASTVRQMLANFEVLLKGIVDEPGLSIAKLPVISGPEKEKMAKWNMTDVDYPKNACLHQLFEVQAKKTPDKIAALFNNRGIAYKELDEKANKLANYLIEFNVGPDIFVGICIDRSLEMLIGLLGILKAGAAYLPMDPEYPDERLAYMMENAQVSVLITQDSLLENLPENKAHIICIDTDWDKISVKSNDKPVLKQEPLPENLAYIIFTSGSTGNPKGVQVPHGAVVNFLTSMADEPGLIEDDVMLAVTTLSFDIAVLELYLPIITGAKTIIVSREVSADGVELLKALKDSKATIMQATPSTWRLLLAAGWEGNDQLKILCGGEAFPKDLLKELIWRVESVWNMYGPTETTVWSTCYLLKDPDEPILVGRPIANTQIYILDNYMKSVPIGVPGELYIGGDGVTRGYLGRPDLNERQFIKDQFCDEENAKLYRTGDLVRYHEDGNIEYLNRLDYQVKVRGFRIELGEIESVISKHQLVKQCVVTIREDRPGDVRLIAYIVPSLDFSKQEVTAYLRSLLPYYMIPHHFVEMKRFSLTPAGKIDRKSLPVPDTENIAKNGQFIEPNTEFEKQICEIWQDVLGIDRISMDDNFFEIGGHSLIAVTVFSKLSEKFGVNMPLATFIKAPTIQEFALVVEKYREKRFATQVMAEKGEWTYLVPIQPHGSRPPLFCMHAIGGNVLNYYSFVPGLGNDQPLFGLQCRGLDGLTEPFQSMKIMAEHYVREILVFQPEGPYYLCGGSMGGIIALEVAQQLKQKGKQIGSLIMFDTYDPDYIYSVGNKNFVPGSDLIKKILKIPPQKLIQLVWTKIFHRLKKLAKQTACSFFRFFRRPIPHTLRYWYIEQKHLKPLFDYKAQLYIGDLTLFFNSHDGLSKDSAMIKGWEKYISGKVNITGIPARHSEFIEDPVLSAKLADCLETIMPVSIIL